jgi:hypothetical protein
MQLATPSPYPACASGLPGLQGLDALLVIPVRYPLLGSSTTERARPVPGKTDALFHIEEKGELSISAISHVQYNRLSTPWQ